LTALYQIPLLLATQEACARIGAVSGQGLAGVIKDHYSRTFLVGVVLLVVVANTINIGADIGAVAAAGGLVVDLPFWLLAVLTTVVVTGFEVFLSYSVKSRATLTPPTKSNSCVYRKLKLGRSDGEARRGSGVNE